MKREGAGARNENCELEILYNLFMSQLEQTCQGQNKFKKKR